MPTGPTPRSAAGRWSVTTSDRSPPPCSCGGRSVPHAEREDNVVLTLRVRTATRRAAGAAVLAAAIALVAGCGGGPTLHPVEGTVSVDGEPVKAGETVTGYVV